MYIFYTVVYYALGLYFAFEELSLLEEKAKEANDFLVKVGYFIDWYIVVMLFPIVVVIRKSYERELTTSVILFSGIFNFLKEVLAFVPKLILLILVNARKLLAGL